jgi:hypothetical protein
MYPQDNDSPQSPHERIADALEQIADHLADLLARQTNPLFKVDTHGNVVTGQLTTVLEDDVLALQEPIVKGTFGIRTSDRAYVCFNGAVWRHIGNFHVLQSDVDALRPLTPPQRMEWIRSEQKPWL